MGEVTTKGGSKTLRTLDPSTLRVVTPLDIVPRVTPVTVLKPKRSPWFKLKLKIHIEGDDDELAALPPRHTALTGPSDRSAKLTPQAGRRARDFKMRMVLKLF